LEYLLARQPRVSTGLLEFAQGAILCAAVAGLEIGTQFIQIEVHVVAGTVFGQHDTVRIEDFSPNGRDAHGSERLADLGVLVAFGR
jgi:hypothetical protein